MTVMEATRQALTPKDVKGWPDAVATALLTIVNNRGVKHRFIDGNHFLLYPPDGDSRPVKFSRSRGEKSNLRYLEMFVNNHLGPYVPEPRDDRPATEKELAALTSLTTRAEKDREKHNEEWSPYIPKGSHEISEYWETNGRVFRCKVCGEITATGNLGVHASVHAGAAEREAQRVWIPIVQQIRKERGLTMSDVGRGVGITGTGYSFWEKKGYTERKHLPRLAAVLGVPEDLLTAETMPAELPPMPTEAEATEQPKPAEPEVPPYEPARPRLRSVERVDLPEVEQIEPEAAAPEAQGADLEASEPQTEQIIHPQRPESPRSALDALLVIQSLATTAVGGENLAQDLLEARARIIALEAELAERDATLDLMREALGLSR